MPPGAAWESAQDSNQLPSYRLTSTHSWHLYTCVGKQLKRCRPYYVSSLHHLCWVSPRCVCEQGKMLQPSQVSTRNFVSEGATDLIFHFIFWEICKLWPRLPWCMWAPKLRNMCLTRGYPSIGPKVQKEVSEKCPIQIYFPTSEQMCWKTWPWQEWIYWRPDASMVIVVAQNGKKEQNSE